MIVATPEFHQVDASEYEQNPADVAIQEVCDLVYYAKEGQFNGKKGDSPFSAVLALGVYAAGRQPGMTIDDEVVLMAVAAVNVTKDPRLSDATRSVLIARLRKIADDFERDLQKEGKR